MLSEDIKPYIVRYPYISNQVGEQPDGNPVLYLGLYVVSKSKNGISNNADLVTATYRDAMVEPGLISRGSHKPHDFEAFDDYVGLVAASAGSYEFQAAIDVYEYGKKNFWFYDNVGLPWNLKKKAWHARMPGVIQHYKLAARQKLNFFDRIWWAIGVAFNGGESGIQMAWLMANVYRNQPRKYIFCDWAVSRLYKKIGDYPNEMGGVFAKYFKGEDHILAKLMKGKI